MAAAAITTPISRTPTGMFVTITGSQEAGQFSPDSHGFRRVTSRQPRTLTGLYDGYNSPIASDCRC